MAFWKRWREPVDLAPRMDETIQLTMLLWAGVGGFSFVVHTAAGRVIGLADTLNIVANALSGLLIAVAMGHAFVAARGWPRWGLALFAVAVIVVAALTQVVADYLLARLILRIDGPLELTMVAMASLIYLLVYGVNLAFIWITTAGRALRDQAVRLAQSEAHALKAELAALRLKLNPHFMFNALDAVDGMIEAGRADDARRMIQRLSGFLRTSFDVGVGHVSLDEELSIVGDYLDVERVRFADRLRLEVRLASGVERLVVPSLLLQPLVENAVKYAVAPSTSPVTVTISGERAGDRLQLVVENSGGDAPMPTTRGFGVGQAATQARLAMLYGDDAVFRAEGTATGYRVEIDLPTDVDAGLGAAGIGAGASHARPA